MNKRVGFGLLAIILLIGSIFVLGLTLFVLGKDVRLFNKAASNQTSSTVNKRVQLLIINPYWPDQGKKLIDYYRSIGWKFYDPVDLTNGIISRLRTVSGDYVNYSIAEVKEIDIPRARDGHTYHPSEVANCLRDSAYCYTGADNRTDYAQILIDNQSCEKRNLGEIDEVWIWDDGAGAPHGLEWLIVGRGAWSENNPGIHFNDRISCTRPLPIMNFNYRVPIASAFHSFGHRVELALSSVFGYELLDGYWGPYFGIFSTQEGLNLFSDFGIIDKSLSTRARCGNVHFPPNANFDSDYGNYTTVQSACNSFCNFQNLANPLFESVNQSTWLGEFNSNLLSTSELGYQTWWLQHLPKAAGKTNGILNNWWKYVVDYENALNDPGLEGAPNAYNSCVAPITHACGDFVCSSDESCSSCPNDCGACSNSPSGQESTSSFSSLSECKIDIWSPNREARVGDYVRYKINSYKEGGTLVNYSTNGSCNTATAGPGDDVDGIPLCFRTMDRQASCGGHAQVTSSGTCYIQAYFSNGERCQADIAVRPDKLQVKVVKSSGGKYTRPFTIREFYSADCPSGCNQSCSNPVCQNRNVLYDPNGCGGVGCAQFPDYTPQVGYQIGPCRNCSDSSSVNLPANQVVASTTCGESDRLWTPTRGGDSCTITIDDGTGTSVRGFVFKDTNGNAVFNNEGLLGNINIVLFKVTRAGSDRVSQTESSKTGSSSNFQFGVSAEGNYQLNRPKLPSGRTFINCGAVIPPNRGKIPKDNHYFYCQGLNDKGNKYKLFIKKWTPSGEQAFVDAGNSFKVQRGKTAYIDIPTVELSSELGQLEYE